MQARAIATLLPNSSHFLESRQRIPCVVSDSARTFFINWLTDHGLDHGCGRTNHPMPRGKFERGHRRMKNPLPSRRYFLGLPLPPPFPLLLTTATLTAFSPALPSWSLAVALMVWLPGSTFCVFQRHEMLVPPAHLSAPST